MGNCKPVPFQPIKIKNDIDEHPAEAYKSMFQALEAIAKNGNRRLTIEYKPALGYVTKYSGCWKIVFMGETFYDRDPIKAIGDAVKLFAKVKGIDCEDKIQYNGDSTAT